MKRSYTIVVILFFFTCNVLFPIHLQACWWKGLPYRSPNVGGGTGSGESAKGGNNDGEGKPNQEEVQDPIYIHNGDYVYRHQDLLIPSRGIDVEINRSYKSQSRFNGRFGLGWEMSYNKRVVPLSNGDVLYYDGNGGEFRFSYIDNSSYISPPEVFDKLTQNPDGRYTLRLKHGTKYNFNQNGTLAEIVDRNNNKLTFTYDLAGKLPIIGVPLYTQDPLTPRLIAYQYMLTKITDTVGREITLTYDSNGRLSKITDFNAREITYLYDGFGHLISVTDPLGNIISYTYDSDRNLYTITDPKGNVYLSNTYNQKDQVIAQTYGNYTGYLSYNPEDKVTQVTDRRGNTRTYYYDKNGNPTKIIDESGNTSLKTYDSNDKMLLTSVIYPKGNSILYEYDGNGNLTKITRKPKTGSSASDIITSVTYEPNYNFVKTITSPEGKITTYYYDYEEATEGDLNGDGITTQTKGNLVKITYPQVDNQSLQVTFTYTPYGEVETITTSTGTITKYEYAQSTGYLTKITNDYGDVTHINSETHFSYDAVGNITSVTDSRSNTTTFEYDLLNQLTKTISAAPFNYQTKYTYDKNGNLTKLERQKDESGLEWQVTEYEYDILDQLTKVKQYLSATEIYTTQLDYDANGNRTKVIDAENNSTTYIYDKLNALWKVTNALGNTTTYVYDSNRNLISITDAKLNTTTYNYDDFDRIIKTTYPDTSFESYTYDQNSNLLTKRTRKGDIISYTYDSLNRVTQKSYPDLSAIDYTYDLAGRLTSVTDSNGTLTYDYDNLNRVVGTGREPSVKVYYEYDSVGNRTKLVYPDTTFVTYDYDQLNRLTAIKDESAATIATYSYDILSRRTQLDYVNNTQATCQYDNLNRLINMANQINAGGDISTFGYTYDKVGNRTQMIKNGTNVHNYSYDNIYQLTEVDYPASIAFTDTTYNYDALGNRATVVNGGTTDYTTNNLNQYTAVNTTTYAYDLNGNLTSDGEWTYNYDYENRLISAGNGSLTATYSYDAFGRRISKSVDGVVTTFLYDGAQVIGEYDIAGILLRKFVYGIGIDEPILMDTGDNTYYYHFDGLGSVTEITDSNSATIESYEYDAFGNTVIRNTFGQIVDTSQISNPYMFTGRRLDSETGLYYCRERYYSPKLGRYLQKDPLTWGPDDRRILSKTIDLRGILMTILGIHVTSKVEKKSIEQDFLLNFQSKLPSRYKIPAQYFANSELSIKTNEALASAILLTVGQFNPCLFTAYTYVSNNPINYIDPYGEAPHLLIIIIAGIVIVIGIVVIVRSIPQQERTMRQRYGEDSEYQRAMDALHEERNKTCAFKFKMQDFDDPKK